MRHLLNKELRLAASPLSFLFLAGGLMTMLPGYPILMGAFFVCLGIFYSFLRSREANDVLYTVLLPVPRGDCVRAKFAFTVLLQLCAFAVCAGLTAVRMTLLSKAEPYVQNALLNATPFYLAFVLLIFAAFNLWFVGGFFKTAYKIGGPFVAFSVAAFVLIAVAETMPHLPPLAFLQNPAGERLPIQFAVLLAAFALYALLTLLSLRTAVRRFEQIDL